MTSAPVRQSASRLAANRVGPAQTGREIELAARSQVVEDRKGRRPVVPFSTAWARQHESLRSRRSAAAAPVISVATPLEEHADPDARAVDTRIRATIAAPCRAARFCIPPPSATAGCSARIGSTRREIAANTPNTPRAHDGFPDQRGRLIILG